MPDEEHELSTGEKVTRACGLCCLGWITFPLFLYVLGNNEKAFVCNQKNIILAEKEATVTACDATPETNKFIALDCDLDKTVWPEFTLASFITEPTQNAFKDHLKFSSLSASMSVPQMFMCTEKKDTVKVDPACRDEKDKKCAMMTVYSYYQAWGRPGGTFAGPGADGQVSIDKIKQACPGLVGNVNPAFPVVLQFGGEKVKAPPQEVKLDGSFYVTRATGSQDFTPDGAITQELAAAAPYFNKQDLSTVTRGVTPTFDAEHVNVVGNQYLQTCATDILGCVRVSFKKNRATGVGFIGSSGDRGKTDSWNMPASWGCDKSTKYWMLPQRINKDGIILKAHGKNESDLYIWRVIGVLGAWAAIYCCLYPIVAFFDICEDYISMVPCIGGCLSVIANIVETLVHIVVCCMSCSFGCSAALFTIAIVWLYMRPMRGALYMCVCIAMVGGAYMLAHMAPKKGGSQARDLSMELQSGAGEA